MGSPGDPRSVAESPPRKLSAILLIQASLPRCRALVAVAHDRRSIPGSSPRSVAESHAQSIDDE